MSPPRLYLLTLAVLFGLMLTGVWSYTINRRMHFLDPDYAQWSAKLDMIDRCDLGEIDILGDSRASAGYVPSLFGSKVRNFALSGATPVETFYEAKRILACPRPPKAIILSFSPRQYGHIDWLWRHAVSYDQLSLAELQEITSVERSFSRSELYGGAFGSEPPPALKNWMYVHHFPPYDFASLIASLSSGRTSRNIQTYRETLANGGQHTSGNPARCATGPAWEASQPHFTSNPVIDAYLHRMLALFAEHHIRLVVATTPITPETARSIRPSYVAEFNIYLWRATRPYTNVVLARDLLTERTGCAFGDVHHMNQQGAVAFSRDYAPVIHRLLTRPAIH